MGWLFGRPSSDRRRAGRPGPGKPSCSAAAGVGWLGWRAATSPGGRRHRGLAGPHGRRSRRPAPHRSRSARQAARMWQRRLDEAVACNSAPAWREWRPLIAQPAPGITEDSFAPILAGRLAAITTAGVDAKQLLRSAADGKPLPDDHAAAALWWRICRHPALLTRVNRDTAVTAAWESRLAETIDAEPAETLHSPLTAERATATRSEATSEPSRRPPKPASLTRSDGDHYLEPDLAVAAMLRDVAGPPEQTDAEVNRMFTRAMAWRECPVSAERMVEVNQLSLAYYRRHLPLIMGAALSGRPVRRRHHRRHPVPTRSRTRRLDGPRRSTAAARGHRSRNADHRCRHDGKHRPADRPVPRPGRLPDHR